MRNLVGAVAAGVFGVGSMMFPGLDCMGQETNSAWFARVWQTDEGLPDNNVVGVVQTPDGYLWVATQTGLASFDGVQFRSIPLAASLPPVMAHQNIRCLALRGSNELWLALDGGGVVSVAPDRTNVFTQVDPQPDCRPLAITGAGDGSVWVGYTDGSAGRIAGGSVSNFTAAAGLGPVGMCWLTVDGKGQLWFAKGGRVGVFREGGFVSLLTLPQRSMSISPARAGGLWLCAGSQFFRYEEGKAPVKLGELASKGGEVYPTVLLEDRRGAVWIGTWSSGLFRYDGKSLSRVETSHNEIRSLMEDREGSVWAGTAGGGLNRLRPRVLEVQAVPSALPLGMVHSICEDASGGLWATVQAELVRREEGVWRLVTAQEGWSHHHVSCVASDREGSVWIVDSTGLYQLRNGQFTLVPQSEPLAAEGITVLLADSAGNLWMGLAASKTVKSLRGGQVRTFAQPPGSGPVQAIAEDPAGSIWLGTVDGFLLRVAGDRLTDASPPSAAQREPIRCLLATPEGSLWIGYAGSGLGRLRGADFARIGVGQGLEGGDICAIAPDDRGALWFATDRGIFQVSRQELEAVAEGRAKRAWSVVYARDEGLRSLQASYDAAPGMVRNRDGSICFALHTGVAVVHPDRVWGNPTLPQVWIERVAMDGRPAEWRSAGASLRLPPGHRWLEVGFTAPVLVAPEAVRFRHRLEGLDEEWSEPGAGRNIRYSRLRAGSYRFRVSACNNAGVWSRNEAALDFVVEPFFWQTWRFRLLAVAVFAGAIGGTVRYATWRKMQRNLERLEQQNAVEKERTRIARDMHDELGAKLTMISFQGANAQRMLAQPAQAGQQIEKMSQTARELVVSLDEIVWAVDPANDSLDNLVSYICRYASDFFENTTIGCQFNIPTALPPRRLPTDVRHNVFLAVKEALNNILKHSGASRAEVMIAARATEFEIVVVDNGQGLGPAQGSEPGKTRRTGHGLVNIEQRLASVGGQMDLQSRAGQGTRIRLIVPLSAARP